MVHGVDMIELTAVGKLLVPLQVVKVLTSHVG